MAAMFAKAAGACDFFVVVLCVLLLRVCARALLR
jgi:hypothetical protein